ncbi:acyl-CoA dehydrogenase family protein [Streptomyces sp. NPDC048442]|uniref:acyl-CoA dehydrogenase family protein n=1 Tax=Streptomyces sp. NPDC048442 TaxID=3154823 RepID=UPI00342C6D93
MPGLTDRELAAHMGKLGWTSILVPTEYGGVSAGHMAKTLLIAHVSHASGAAGGIQQASLIRALALQDLRSPEQQSLWLPQIAAGHVLRRHASR